MHNLSIGSLSLNPQQLLQKSKGKITMRSGQSERNEGRPKFNEGGISEHVDMKAYQQAQDVFNRDWQAYNRNYAMYQRMGKTPAEISSLLGTQPVPPDISNYKLQE